MTAITCMNCGTNGEIEISGTQGDNLRANIFRYLGHNPLSGHMHYQCPACSIVLLVEPQNILMSIADPSVLLPTLPKKNRSLQNLKLIQSISCFKSLFRNRADLNA